MRLEEMVYTVEWCDGSKDARLRGYDVLDVILRLLGKSGVLDGMPLLRKGDRYYQPFIELRIREVDPRRDGRGGDGLPLAEKTRSASAGSSRGPRACWVDGPESNQERR
jgi:hypothetical protein